MNSLADKLNCHIDVYEVGTEQKNEFGELDKSYRKKKSVWAAVQPLGGREKDGKGNTAYAEISHKFILRRNALPRITGDMYFVFQGRRYDVMYFYPNYKTKETVDIFCRLKVET